MSYESALKTMNLEDLETRRIIICLNFSLKASKSIKFSKWFVRNQKSNTRFKRAFHETFARNERFKRTPINYLTKLLNEHHRKTKSSN